MRKGDVTRDDSQRPFSAQQSVATLFQLVATLFLNTVPTLQRCVALKIVVANRPVKHHLGERFDDSLKILEFTRICMENHTSMTGLQKLFSHTNASNFRRPLQSLLSRYTAQNSQVT